MRISFSAATLTADDAGHPVVRLSTRTGWILNLAFHQGIAWSEVLAPDGTVYAIDARANRFADKTDFAAQNALARFQGAYTAAMFADFTLGTTTNRLPGGFASMTFRVDTRGNVRMAGILPNGKTFSRSAPLQLYALDDGTPAAGVPLFAPFVNGRDLLSALVWFSPVVDFVELSVDTGNGWFVTWEDNAPGGYGTVRLALAGYPWRTPPVLRNLALLADPGDIPWYESRAAVASGFLRWDAIKRGIPLTLNTRGTGFTLPRGTAPVLNAGDYDYSAANSARATFSLSASTGVFSGSFNGYLGVTGARGPVLRTARATCRGVLLCQPDGTLAIGAGAGLVAETEPALKALRLKRSFPVMLSPIP